MVFSNRACFARWRLVTVSLLSPHVERQRFLERAGERDDAVFAALALIDPDLAAVFLYVDGFPRSLEAYRKEEGLNKPVYTLKSGRLRRKTAGDRRSGMLGVLDARSHLWRAYQNLQWKAGRLVPVGECWQLNRAVLDEMLLFSREHSIPLLFVHIPYHTWRPFPTLKKYMAAREADFIDLLDHRPRDTKRLYLPVDKHFNEEGHRFVANILEAWIRENRPEFHVDE